MKKLLTLAAATACLATAAVAEDAPYLKAGQRLAEANCAQCHTVAPGGAFKLYPPSFAAIAAYMAPDVIRIKIMYPDHSVMMPQFHTFMFAENLDNVVGYIQSLEE